MSQTTNTYVAQFKEQENILYLYMNPPEYKWLSDISKVALINKEATKHDAQMVYVIYAYKGELWQKINGTMTMIDSWDKESVTTLQDQKQNASIRSIQHPWFFNLSGALNHVDGGVTNDNPSRTFYNAYCRVGCYLLSGRWDFAINGNIGYSKTFNEIKGSYSNSIGVDSRVYILKGKSVNPFAGIGLAYASSGNDSSVTVPLTAGLSIPVKGKGCIEFCYQYNKVTKSAIIAGYTYMH